MPKPKNIEKKLENEITDFFAKYGVKNIQMGRTKIVVSDKKLKTAKKKK